MEAAPPHNKLPKLSIKVSSFGANSSVQKITKIDKETVRFQPRLAYFAFSFYSVKYTYVMNPTFENESWYYHVK